MKSATDDRKFKAINRRELLKLTPVLALGAFAIPKLQKPLLKSGLAFSDWHRRNGSSHAAQRACDEREGCGGRGRRQHASAR